MFKKFFSKLVKVVQVITGKDEVILAAKIKQAEMKAACKAEISSRDIFETVDTEIIVPESVKDVFKAKLLSKYDNNTAKAIYNLINLDFDTMFVPELCFKLISEPNAVDTLINRYVEKYVRIETDRVSKADMKAYFKRMAELEAILTAEEVDDDFCYEEVEDTTPEPLPEPIPIKAKAKPKKEDAVDAIVQTLISQNMLQPKGNQKITLAGDIGELIDKLF